MVPCNVAKYENTVCILNVISVTMMMEVWSQYFSPFCNADFHGTDDGVIFSVIEITFTYF